MGLIHDCETYFGTNNLYEVLAVGKSASPLEIKKAYKKASLLIHPDRVAADSKQNATRKFQVLCQVHFILSDVEKRATYDEVGLVDEENCISESDAGPEFWDQYWRNLFPKITKKDIDTFFSKYKGSDEEIKDLKECYVKYEGDMNHIAETFLGYHVDEEDRFREILTDLINNEEIPGFPKFLKESKTKRAARIKRFKGEAKEAAEEAGKLEAGESDLMKAMSKRSQERESQFNSLIQSLEAKYGNETKGKRKKR